MDVAFLLDNSRNIASDEFKDVKALVSSMLDNFDIASDPMVSGSGDRIALLSYSPWDRRERDVVKTEFEFTTYNSQALMKRHIETNLPAALNGEATIGHALLWAVDNLFPST